MHDDSFEVDLLIVGGGMAGITAAVYAAEYGCSVLVVEKQSEIGGSAILSGGGLWTAADYETLRRVNPLGDASLARVLVEGYDAVGDFIASLGTDITEPEPYLGTQSFPAVMRHLNVTDYMARCRASVQASGGWIIVDSTVSELHTEQGCVTGACVSGPDGEVKVRAKYTLLTTGGFQNDPTFRSLYLEGNAGNIAVRSNRASDGWGLRLGLSVGAVTSDHMSGWYGHTIPYPFPLPLEPSDFLPAAQFFLSPRSILLDSDGRRFTDESLGYYLNAQAVSTLPDGRALLLFDEKLHTIDTERYGVDRFEFARRRGARVAQGSSWQVIADQVEQWGYRSVADAVAEFNSAIASGKTMQPDRLSNRVLIEAAPFYAMEVQPAITFTHGGLRIDEHARVLGNEGIPIPGLLAAGADAGGTYHRAYAGGLAMAAVFGMTAARTACEALNLSKKDMDE